MRIAAPWGERERGFCIYFDLVNVYKDQNGCDFGENSNRHGLQSRH